MGRIETLFRLDNKIAVVSGGAGLIGARACEILAEAGADLVIADHNIERAQAEAARIAAGSGRRVEARSVDITNEVAVGELAADVDRIFGRSADILLNLAAYRGGVEYFSSPLGEYPKGEWDRARDLFDVPGVWAADVRRRGRRDRQLFLDVRPCQRRPAFVCMATAALIRRPPTPPPKVAC